MISTGGHHDQCQIFEDREQTHADYPGFNLQTKEYVTCSLDISKNLIKIVVYGWHLEKSIEFPHVGAFTFRNGNDWVTITSKAILLKVDGNLYQFDRTLFVVDWGTLPL